jgi:hypothetical protein
MANLNQLPHIWVVHRSKRKNSKPKLELFKDTRIDDIITINKRVPLIPIENEIMEIGIGNEFEKIFTKKYKL